MKQRHILVVEDNPVASQQFAAVLAGQGYDVVAARDGQAALEFLAANPPPTSSCSTWRCPCWTAGSS
jgi:CheY-like chemotaxis protein